jgi:hypothetical protein
MRGLIMLHRTTLSILAALQTIIGWEWLMSGGNKLLSGARHTPIQV